MSKWWISTLVAFAVIAIDNSRGNCGEQVHTDDEDEVDGPAATAAKTRKGGITDERN